MGKKNGDLPQPCSAFWGCRKHNDGDLASLSSKERGIIMVTTDVHWFPEVPKSCKALANIDIHTHLLKSGFMLGLHQEGVKNCSEHIVYRVL